MRRLFRKAQREQRNRHVDKIAVLMKYCNRLPQVNRGSRYRAKPTSRVVGEYAQRLNSK